MICECCQPKSIDPRDPDTSALCPRCLEAGRQVDLVTLKSLLVPEAMKRLDTKAAYRFCKTRYCPVVYFSGADVFTTDELIVPVFQKDRGESVPVCYCFGFTRKKIDGEIERTGKSTAVQEVTDYVKHDRCACEIRNPQGSCCLGNLDQTVKEMETHQQRRPVMKGMLSIALASLLGVTWAYAQDACCVSSTQPAAASAMDTNMIR